MRFSLDAIPTSGVWGQEFGANHSTRFHPRGTVPGYMLSLSSTRGRRTRFRDGLTSVAC